MTPDEYRDTTLTISRVRNEPLDEHQAAASLYALGLMGEAGEVCDEIKKALFHGKELDREALLKEIGDVLWYVDRLLLWLGYTVEDAMVANVAKLRARYPNGWDAAERHHTWSGTQA